MDRTGRAKLEAGERWWQDWRWIASTAAVLMAVGFCAFVAITVTTHEQVADQVPVIERLDRLAVANAAAIQQIEGNQTGIDSLVAFVEEVRADQAAQGDDDTVATIFEILCSSSDPVRIEACQRLRGTP